MISLAVKYRPQKFDDVVSQNSTITILNKQIENNDFQNCYLFAGASGCGKTTVARIFANEINNYQGSPIEIDAASNNGVDNVRNMIASAKERSLDAEYKIYIIDECHSLTKQAWESFLKCIEEPPKYTIFIFCTTDPQKVPATIQNRVMRFNFSRITSDKIKSRLEFICEKEGFVNYSEACSYISRICGGGMRDAISILDKCANYSTDLSMSNILSAIGDFSYDMMFKLINAVIDGDEGLAFNLVNNLYDSGADMKMFVNQLFGFVLDISKYIIQHEINMTKLPYSYKDDLEFSIKFDNAKEYYNYVLNKLFKLREDIKTDTDIKSLIDFYIIQLCRCM